MITQKKLMILPLTSIRGLAALSVLWYHIAVSYSSLDISYLKLFVHGSLAVDLFFVLSGYIMAHVYIDSYDKESPFLSFYKQYIFARLSRIYPLHFVTLIVLLALVIFLPGFSERYSPENYSLKAFLLNIMLVQNWGIVGMSWNMVSWSISAEWFMYLLFPCILAFTKRFLNSLRVVAMLVLLLLITHYFLILFLELDGYGGLSLGGMIRVFFEFCFGFYLYQFYVALRDGFNFLKGPIFSFTLYALLLVIFFTGNFYYFFVPLVGLVILNLSVAQNCVAKILSLKPFVHLGDISYSFYLWHWIVLQVSNWLVSTELFQVKSSSDVYGLAIILTVLNLMIATISHSLIEIKGKEYMRSLLGQKIQVDSGFV